jgi:hypothetical protein
MQNLFDPNARETIIRRLSELQPSSPRQWGKMNAAQMLDHCAAALEVPCGDRVKKQRWFGRLVAPFVRSSMLGEKPFPRDAPTDPDLKITDDRDFARERERLAGLVQRFGSRGPSAVDGVVHGFFGPLNSDQWGRLMYKHLDHHLRQFSA